jgi:predicted rRNA methylase YqxC with S4 and FtsJ domains
MADQQDNPFVSRGGLKLRHALDAFAEHVDPAGLCCADLGCSTGGFTDCLLRAGAARVFAVDTAYGELAWTLRNDDRVVVLERSNALHVEVPGEVTERGGVDLVVIDLGWTPQSKAIPAALRWIRPERGPGASLGSDSEEDAPVGGEPRLAPGPRMARAPEHSVSDEPEAPARDGDTEDPSLALRARREAGDVSSSPRIITLIKPHYEVAKPELGPKGVLDPGRAAEVVEDVLGAMPGLGVRVLGCVESPIVGGKRGGKKKGRGTGNKEWLALVEPA